MSCFFMHPHKADGCLDNKCDNKHINKCLKMLQTFVFKMYLNTATAFSILRNLAVERSYR